MSWGEIMLGVVAGCLFAMMVMALFVCLLGPEDGEE